MKLTILLVLFMIFLGIFCNNDLSEKFQQIEKAQAQCEGLVEILENMTTQNAEIQSGIVNIAVFGSKTLLNIDCVLKNL